MTTADGTALAGRDYRAKTIVLTFQPGGSLVQQVRVQVIGNRRREPDRSLFVRLSIPSNLTLADAEALGTILDDDQP